MSFILDALKKSESDRQRQAHPESAFIATQPADRKPGRWVWVVAALLGVNVIVLVIFMITVKKPATHVIAAPTQNIEPTGTDDSTFRDRVAEARKATGRMERSSQAPQRASPCSAGVLHLIA